VRQVTLYIHLGLLALGRSRQGDNPEDARADAPGDRLDSAALAGPVTAFEEDHHLQALLDHPGLQVYQLGLEFFEFLEVYPLGHSFRWLALGLALGLLCRQTRDQG
jgi:hypothetical protein